MLESIEKLRIDADKCTTKAGADNDKFDTVWMTKSVFLDRIDEIEQEVAERFVELPVDADGEYIHIGDVCTCDDQYDKLEGAHEVRALSYHMDGTWCARIDPIMPSWYDPNMLHHYHEPTVDELLIEFLDRATHEVNEPNDLLAEYAAKLQLKEADDA